MTRTFTKRIGLMTLLIAGSLAGGMIVSRVALSDNEYASNWNGRSFSNRDFKGNYAMLETGKADGMDFIEVAQVRADGNGNVKIDYVATLGAQIPLKGSVTCTYQTRSNGLGELFCRDDQSGEETNGDFVIGDGGREVKAITKPNPRGWTTATMRRQ